MSRRDTKVWGEGRSFFRGNRRTAVAVTGLVLLGTQLSISTAQARVWTDFDDYRPGSTVTIHGDNSDSVGFVAGETVRVSVSGPNGFTQDCDGVTDGDGAWSCDVKLVAGSDAVGAYSYTATAQTSGVVQSGGFSDADCSDIASYPWMDTTKTPEQRATALIAASTLDQELRWLNEQAANNPTQTTFSGVTYPVQVACTPVIVYTDGPQAVSGSTGITAFPSQMAIASSFDQTLSRTKGKAQADEAWRKAKNVILGPGVHSARTPLAGRTSEYFGEDPVLSGTLAGAMIRGIQEDNPSQPVEADLKHYVANEQEVDRTTSSSNMDERTLRETYALPVEIAVKTGKPGSVMCAYNQINSLYACENPTTLNQILKGDVGYGGFVMSDFGAVHSTAPSLNAGLDQELNRPIWYTPTLLKAALTAGTISRGQVDEAAKRVIRAHIQNGLFDKPLQAAQTNVSTPANQAVARKVAQEGAVLLKNEGNILPLSGTGKRIAVIGQTASNTATGGISATSVCAYTAPSVSCPAPVSPLTGITNRATQDGNTVVYASGADTAAAAALAATADVTVVFGYYREGEFSDRANISLDGNGDALINAVATANPNTVVVLQTGGPVVMPWLSKVKGVFEAWYGGQEMGNAIASLLWGDVNPSGKLPQTFPKALADTPAAGSAAQYPGIFTATGTSTPPSPRAGAIRQVSYSEGLKIGYRWYESQGIEPLFPFGFGLSYTTFGYSDLSLTRHTDQSVDVKFTIKNTGARAGAESAQVYVDFPSASNEPSKLLKGYDKVFLQPGESKDVVVTLDKRSFSHWDTGTHAWKVADGKFRILVGASSQSLSLAGSVWPTDWTAPSINLTAPLEAATQTEGAPGNYALNSTQTAQYSCSDELSGVASCVGTTPSGAAIDTSTVGLHSYSVTTTDEAGNTSTVTRQYNVVWPGWSNFYQPIDNGNTLNVAKAGSSIPVKFSLGGSFGPGILAAGYPKTQVITCDSSAPTDEVEETVTAGQSTLQYDASTGRYTYVWKTDKAWGGTCRTLIIRLADNTVHTAQFKFAK